MPHQQGAAIVLADLAFAQHSQLRKVPLEGLLPLGNWTVSSREGSSGPGRDGSGFQRPVAFALPLVRRSP